MKKWWIEGEVRCCQWSYVAVRAAGKYFATSGSDLRRDSPGTTSHHFTSWSPGNLVTLNSLRIFDTCMHLLFRCVDTTSWPGPNVVESPALGRTSVERGNIELCCSCTAMAMNRVLSLSVKIAKMTSMARQRVADKAFVSQTTGDIAGALEILCALD